jgi:putative membrane protein
MGLMMLLVWAVVIAGIIWAVRTADRNERSGSSRRRPIDILAARYARGEIDEDEFDRRRRQLEAADL